jgi:hypothetical protein
MKKMRWDNFGTYRKNQERVTQKLKQAIETA